MLEDLILTYLAGSPYCLRRNATALRNMRDYTGVSTSRLETLEDRLRSDVIAEIEAFQGRVLLHTESADGEVVPVWETVERGDVHSLRDVMAEAADAQTDVKLNFVRIPITSESSPDVRQIFGLARKNDSTDICSFTTSPSCWTCARRPTSRQALSYSMTSWVEAEARLHQ